MGQSKTSKTLKPRFPPHRLGPRPQSQPYVDRYNQIYMPSYYPMQQFYQQPDSMGFYNAMEPQPLGSYSTVYPPQLMGPPMGSSSMGSPTMGSPTMFYMSPNQIGGLNNFSMSPSASGSPLSQHQQRQPQQRQSQSLALKENPNKNGPPKKPSTQPNYPESRSMLPSTSVGQSTFRASGGGHSPNCAPYQQMSSSGLYSTIPDFGRFDGRTLADRNRRWWYPW